jgi:hypothetical protein
MLWTRAHLGGELTRIQRRPGIHLPVREQTGVCLDVDVLGHVERCASVANSVHAAVQVVIDLLEAHMMRFTKESEAPLRQPG